MAQSVNRKRLQREGRIATHRLGDVIHNHSAVRIAVVHGCQRLVSLLPSRVPRCKQNVNRAARSWRNHGPTHQISNLIVVLSSRLTVCVRKAAGTTLETQRVNSKGRRRKESSTHLRLCSLCSRRIGPSRNATRDWEIPRLVTTLMMVVDISYLDFPTALSPRRTNLNDEAAATRLLAMMVPVCRRCSCAGEVYAWY